MNTDLHERQVAYRTAMAMANRMLFQGLITDAEYHKIDRTLAEKYGQIVINNNGRIPLISQDFRANMSATQGGGYDGEKDREG